MSVQVLSLSTVNFEGIQYPFSDRTIGVELFGWRGIGPDMGNTTLGARQDQRPFSEPAPLVIVAGNKLTTFQRDPVLGIRD